MATTEKRTFSLLAEQAAFIDAQVKNGAFATASEVVDAGLRALQEREAVARWLREEVVATYDAATAHPENLISSEDVAERMRRRHEARMRDGA